MLSSDAFYTYILWSETLKKYYVGSTNDLGDRINRHNRLQEKFTRIGVPWILVCYQSFSDRKLAVRLENKIKKRRITRFLDDLNSESLAL